MEKLLRLSPGSPEARELRMCTSFANSGPLPLLFVDSIFGGHPGELESYSNLTFEQVSRPTVWSWEAYTFCSGRVVDP